jgi:sugar lactone lactonase YvrE
MLSGDRITGVVTHHGEGPFWDAKNERLLCVDLLAGAIVAVSSSGEVNRYDVPSPVASLIRRRRSGGFVIGTERGVAIADERLSEFANCVEVSRVADVRTNDGGCDRFGTLFLGTMAYDERPGGGALYRVMPDGRVTSVLQDVTISNGVQWSADGMRAFYVDSASRRVDVFDVDPESGAWSRRRVHIELDSNPGFPDGMAIDEEDGLWVAMWGGGSVGHYDAVGRLVETIRVPGVTQVSSCAFGGENRGRLYVTTSRQGLAADREPDAGAVFASETGVCGAAVPEFWG